MKDQISITRIATLHPKYIPQATALINKFEDFTGRVWRVVQAFRTFAYQQELWNQGRTTPGPIVTWAPPGSTPHNYGLAFDTAPFLADMSDLDWHYDYSLVAQLAKDEGVEWGGLFPPKKKDFDHYQNWFGLTWEECLHKYQTHDFIPKTQFINIP